VRWPWIRRRAREKSLAGAQEATRSAEASRVQAEADWLDAMKRRPEAVRVTKELREHNAANRYDDWLTTIVRR